MSADENCVGIFIHVTDCLHIARLTQPALEYLPRLFECLFFESASV